MGVFAVIIGVLALDALVGGPAEKGQKAASPENRPRDTVRFGGRHGGRGLWSGEVEK